LAGTAKELEEHKTELENKVVERTRELHDAHAKLQESYERLKEIDRLKSEFLANMSHELRTPLNSIIGFSKVILKGIDGPITDIQKTDLTAIHQSGQHLLTIINDILDLSKIESGKMELLKEMIDIGEIAEGVVSTVDSLIIGKPVKLKMELEEELPATFVDKTRIRQVMLNILSNAVKFTDKGEIRLKVRKIRYEDMKTIENNPDGYCPKRSPVREGDFILVSVTDTGIGIKREDMPMVFEEFRQIDSSSARKEGGTGLGMAISNKFILLHGGEIWVESRPGIGSVFHFTVPVSETAEKTLPAIERVIAPIDREKEVIMVIDDEINSITLLRRTLEKEGYEVVGIQDPNEAIKRVGEIKPNAIILDVIMPKRDGWEIIQELKSKPETKDIPVIFCTIIADKKLGFSLGASDYLVKPVRDDDLLRSLRMLNGSIKKIVVIDDNPQDAELVGRFLKGHGYTVKIALGGREGIGYIKRHKPELIIVDLMMPEVDGFAVIEEAKSNPATKDIPIIVVSAKDITAEDRKRLNGYIEVLIGKGMLNEDELMQEIVKALKKVRGER
ncbi:MAG: response regulator, partial [Nitrospinae bacterium]|nr:response regulator [Nitrospinota bacterium]